MASRHSLVYRRRYRWLGISALALGFMHAALFHPVSDLMLAMATAFFGGKLLISVFVMSSLLSLRCGCGGFWVDFLL